MNSLGTDFDALLAQGASAALAACAAWAVLVLASVATEAVTHGRVRLGRLTGCPDAWRRRLLAALIALVTGPVTLAGAAHATESDQLQGGPGPATLDGLALPDRVSGGPRAAADVRRTGVVVVEPGDSLWLLVRRILPATATDDRVATVVAALHAHNRRTVGPDPDLIHPGQRLRLPAGATEDFPDPTTLPEEP